jgi:hypothetical protein
MSRTRTTHTYVILEISDAAFQEIKEKLEKAGYQHAFHEDEGRTVIDMHGIAVASDGIRRDNASDYSLRS